MLVAIAIRLSFCMISILPILRSWLDIALASSRPRRFDVPTSAVHFLFCGRPIPFRNPFAPPGGSSGPMTISDDVEPPAKCQARSANFTSQDEHMRSLAGTVALVAGGTRGAGHGIAAELGAAGATVYVTGRTTQSQTSEYRRPETIEETAAFVTELGGEGIAVRVDHLVPAEVAALVARIRASAASSTSSSMTSGAAAPVRVEQGGLGARSGERVASAAACRRHASHHRAPRPAAPDREPGGLLVEVTDGTAEYNADHYRLSVFYDLAKTRPSAWPRHMPRISRATERPRFPSHRVDALRDDARQLCGDRSDWREATADRRTS